jgi:hypothetical protein
VLIEAVREVLEAVNVFEKSLRESASTGRERSFRGVFILRLVERNKRP